MQAIPDAPTLLRALAAFLAEEVQPALEDRGLAFRVRIAAFLAGVLAREASLGEAQLRAEAAGLRGLLGGTAPPAGGEPLIAWVEAANATLAALIRADDPRLQDPGALRAHLQQTLRADLAIVQPDFDTRGRLAGD